MRRCRSFFPQARQSLVIVATKCSQHERLVSDTKVGYGELCRPLSDERKMTAPAPRHISSRSGRPPTAFIKA
jgi:hypothetical protein